MQVRPSRRQRSLNDRGALVQVLEPRTMLTIDLGDAPTPYPTTLAENGAQHTEAGATLGATRDGELDATHSANADSDGADEDGVTFGAIQIGDLGATVTANVTGGTGKLDAWIDFNGDGNWGGAGEQIFASQNVVAGDNSLTFDVPSTAQDGQTFARFRLSTAGNLGPEGLAADGEVEDYAVTITPPTAASGLFGGQNTVTTGAVGAESVFAADVDGDGDLDLLSASAYDNQIAWYENDGSQNFTAHTITTAASAATNVTAADVDGDGDLDVLSASLLDDKIAWYENDGSQNFTAHTISTAAMGAFSVTAADVDGDGDLDVLSASLFDNRIAWYEHANVATPPVLAISENITYTENAPATVIDTGITVADADSATLASATVTITNFVAGQDVLTLINVPATMGNVAVSTNVSGVLTLTSAGATATKAQWQTALRAVKYFNTSDNPTTTQRSVTFVVNDGAANSNTLTSTISITAVNDLASILEFDTTATFTEEDAATLLDTDATVTDVDSADFDTGSLKVYLNNAAETTDRLEIRHQGDSAGQIGVSGANVSFGGALIGTFVGGSGLTPLVISFNASANPAATQALLRNLTYRNVSENSSGAQRVVRLALNDGDGSTRIVSKPINVVRVNDAPVLAVPSTFTYTENLSATIINLLATVNDLDNTTLSTATIVITNFVAGQDVLSFTAVPATMGNIALTTNVSGVMTLTSAGRTATLAQWRAALRAVKYFNTSDAPTTTARTVTFVVNDGTSNSNTLTNTINLTAVADAPVITNFTDAITFTEGGAALLIDTDLTVSDPDTPDTGGGVLKVYTNVVSAADRLAIRNQGVGAGLIGTSGANVTFGGVVIGTFSGGVSTTALTITLNASARYASVQALLRNVTFQNTSATPVVTPRTLRISYHNGLERIVSKTLNVVATIPQPALKSDSPAGQPAANNPFVVDTNSPRTKRRRATLAPDSNAPAALNTASVAQRRANRRRGL